MWVYIRLVCPHQFIFQNLGRSVVVQLLSHIWLFETPWTTAHQASCPSPSPRDCSNSCPSSWWCHPIISSSIVSFSSCLQSFLASGSFSVSQFFASGGQSTGALASVLPIQDWFSFRIDWFDILAVQSTDISTFIDVNKQHQSQKKKKLTWSLKIILIFITLPVDLDNLRKRTESIPRQRGCY